MNDPVLSVRIKNDKEGPQTGDVVLNGSAINEWATGNSYDIGDVVVYDNQFYQSLEEQVAEQSFDYDKWQQIGIPDIIVNDFKPNTHYDKDEVITYNNKLYKAKQDFTSSTSFYVDDWISVSGETYTFTSEDRTVTITLTDSTVDFSVDTYVKTVKDNLEAQIDNKVDKEANKGLSSNDYTTSEKTKLLNLASIFTIGDNLVLDANGRLNAGFSVDFDSVLDKTSTNGIQNKPVAEAVEALQDADTALDSRVTTNTSNIASNTTKINTNTGNITILQGDVSALQTGMNSKVDKETGKELSSNDYTDADQTKLGSLAPVYSIGTNLTLTGNVLSADDQRVELKSTTGTSTTAGMTQYAITEAINDAISGGLGTLAPVATSGSYNDLTDTPTIDSTLSTTSTNAVQNKVITEELADKADASSLAAVATSGAYSDLSGTPTIPANVSDLADASDYPKFTDLADVATTGDYNDLINQPSAPNDAEITLYRDDSLTLVGAFTVNQRNDSSISLPRTNIRAYTTGASYKVDEIVTKDSSIYKCINTIASAPATMVDADWEMIGGKPMETLTIKDAEGTTLGTYDGSADVTVTLPESFEVLTNAEIDTIWENA